MFGQNEPIKVQNFRLSATHVKLHQICTLIGSLNYKVLAKKYRGVISHDPEDPHDPFICFYCAKYLRFDLKKYRGVIFRGTEGWCKIWRKTDLWFEKWHDEYGKFSPEHLQVSKLGLWWDPLIQNRRRMTLKSTEEFCVTTMNNDAKFEEDLACHFKIDTRNLNQFWFKLLKVSKIFILMWSFWAEYIYSVSLQILYPSSVSWKITPLYFF